MNNPSNKKAVHVKWAGKTIALGTFPVAEADEKCARAKALTRAWRSTMRPKPTREWVMNELERLNVRVVAGRPAREANGSDDDGNDNGPVSTGPPGVVGAGGASSSAGGTNPVASNGGGDLQNNPSSIHASILNAARGIGLDTSSYLNQRRNSSLAMSLLDNDGRDANVAIAAAAVAAMGNGINKSDTGPHHRPLVGGGSAAAYEAARADYYRNQAEKKNNTSRDILDISDSNRASLSGGTLPGNSRRLSSLGGSLGGLLNGDSSNNQIGDAFNNSNGNNNAAGKNNGGSSYGLNVNPNAHYEMLKLHHMNLLNEIQETTLMMNLYQQQQQQQKLQQEKLEKEKALLAQQHYLDQSMGRKSLGLGSYNGQNNDSISTNTPAAAPPPSAAAEMPNTFASKNAMDSSQETKQTEAASTALNEHEKQLQSIKDEIEKKRRELAELEKAETSKALPTREKQSEANQNPPPKIADIVPNEDGARDDDDDDDDDDNEENETNENLKTNQISDVTEPPMKKTKIAV